MRDLTEIRQQIDQIDQKMLALFKERMGCSAEVAEYKRGKIGRASCRERV